MSIIAIPASNGRVSPLFDTASRLLVVEVGAEGEYTRFEADISEGSFPGKMMRLRELKVERLICGAISGQGAHMLANAGIKVLPWISGELEDVLRAYLRGGLLDTQFLMPGHPDYWDRGQGLYYGQGGEQEHEVVAAKREP